MHSSKLVYMAALILFLTPGGYSQDGAELFRKNCAACHSIGKGKLVGPDLAGVTGRSSKSWLVKFIRNSGEMIRSGDPDAVAVGKQFNNLLMPAFAGSDNDISAIIGYISSQGGQAQLAVADTFLNAASEENVIRGRELFSGKTALSNSGAPCIGCHTADNSGYGGGQLAKSLNLSFYMMKGQGLKALLESPPFPAMTTSYQTRPLTPQEVYDLSAFLRDASVKRISGGQAPATFPFLWIGAGLWLFAVLVLLALWYRRKRLSVNHSIFSRQLSTE